MRWLGTLLPWEDLPLLPFPIGTSAGSGARGDAKGHGLDWKLIDKVNLAEKSQFPLLHPSSLHKTWALTKSK